MNIAMKLTLDGLLEALRWKVLERKKDDGSPTKSEAGRKLETEGNVTDGK